MSGNDAVRLEAATEKAREVIAELKEIVREAHGVKKDLTNTLREAASVIADVTPEAVKGVLGKELESASKALSAALVPSIATAQQAVFDRFDRLEQSLLDVASDVGFEDVVGYVVAGERLRRAVDKES